MWRCTACHSTAVEGLGWTELNSNSSTGDIAGDDSDDYWCDACETHTTVYFKEEPDEKYLTDIEDDNVFDPDDFPEPELPDNLS